MVEARVVPLAPHRQALNARAATHQPWSPDAGVTTFVRNHACELLACDFFATVTAWFRLVYAFVVLDVGTRQFLHWNVTDR